eukprot:TRINITY_DN13596_c0_g1_i1.p1 TRINITY_DN13596_c0_g1~~TRINITY_DN13596_c0_g1_i1.p1  ORF type:complete len:279 (-),score=28.44 TRINITY_DN13596_c0_g1_i1:191-985(-)
MSRDLASILSTETIPLVDIRKGTDISTHPSHPRISFPSPYTPAFKILKTDDLNVVPESWPCVSRSCDVSSSPTGVCMVTCNIVCVTNSHAGTHADQPLHFVADSAHTFADAQYNGTATILNVSSEMNAETGAIDDAALQRAAAAANVQLNTVFRLLLRTYAAEPPATWTTPFGHLTPAAAQLLASLPHLVLLGTDAPSVDHPSASPIIEHSHGSLWAQRVAILEGLDFTALPLQGAVHGVLQTVWCPTQQFDDARGCVCTFYRD